MEKEPGVKYLLDEMINDGKSRDESPQPQTPLPKPQPSKKRKLFAPMNQPRESDFSDDSITIPVQQKLYNAKPKRRKSDFIDGRGIDDDDEGSIDISDIPPPDNVKFLPKTIDGLRTSFKKVLQSIARKIW